MSATVVVSILLGALAVLFTAVGVRDREPGTGWLALSYALAALWYANADRLAGVGLVIDTPMARFGAVLIGAAVLAAVVGVSRYLGPAVPRARAAVIAMCVPALLMFAALAAGADVPRRLFHIGTLAAYVGVAIKAWTVRHREPGAGHGLLAVILLSLPVTPVVMQLAGMGPEHLRYLVSVQPVLFGLVLLAVALLRRRGALQSEILLRIAAEQQLREANQQLEQRVAQRTAHLHELIRALEAFNRNVSHDLRGPLGSIAQLAQLAHEAVASGRGDAAGRWLEVLAAQTASSCELVGTLLDLARLGDAAVDRRRVPLGALVDEAFGEALIGHAAAGATPPKLVRGPLTDVFVDPALLRRALVNLLGNAVKFSRQAAEPTVRVEAGVSGDDVTVRVIDNGVGFDAQARDTLFQPFQRLHGADFEGTGLGLTIVRQAVERHGGRVWAESAPGAGATFAFTLPGAVVMESSVRQTVHSPQ